MRNTALQHVHELARSDERIVFIGSDLRAGTLSEMQDEMPDRFFMEGIAEAHLINMAVALALEGFIPYINTIATFLTRRCYEQLAVGACLHQAKIRLIGNGAGLAYAALGPTHQATEDIAILRALPGMAILAPADAQEMAQLMPQTVDYDGPLYLRMAKGRDPIVSDASHLQLGQAVRARAGEDVLLITTGIMRGAAQDAADVLAEQGVSAEVLHFPTLVPFDANSLQAALGHRIAITIEEHTITGGLGSCVAEVIAESDAQTRLLRLGIPNRFADRYGKQADLLRYFGLHTDGIVNTVKKLL